VSKRPSRPGLGSVPRRTRVHRRVGVRGGGTTKHDESSVAQFLARRRWGTRERVWKMGANARGALAAKGNSLARPGKAEGFGVTAGVTSAGALACVLMNKGVHQLGLTLARLSRKVALGGEDRVRHARGGATRRRVLGCPRRRSRSLARARAQVWP
jgi:hypothetical protein